ncbi:hypothetical protein [uncultured Bilophila sp.]|uniref:hypothetical protein n=1 Tax=uncultured Bilophila sp. TaxID=529385 RepID=UPI0026DCE8AA|nr:hypothetical protein [uncultured Bilophila sp.]
MNGRLPPHILLLLAMLMLAAGWCPCAEAGEAAAHGGPASIDQVVSGGRDLPLLVEAQPRLPQVREHELSRKDGQQPVAFRPAQPAPAQPPAAEDTGRPSTDCVPPRPSWRGLVAFPLPPPSC